MFVGFVGLGVGFAEGCFVCVVPILRLLVEGLGARAKVLETRFWLNSTQLDAHNRI